MFFEVMAIDKARNMSIYIKSHLLYLFHWKIPKASLIGLVPSPLDTLQQLQLIIENKNNPHCVSILGWFFGIHIKNMMPCGYQMDVFQFLFSHTELARLFLPSAA